MHQMSQILMACVFEPQTMSWWEGEIKDMIKKESCKRIDAIIHTECKNLLSTNIRKSSKITFSDQDS